MNTSVISKCIAELQRDTPDLSYLRGMLETLLDMQPEELPKHINVFENGAFVKGTGSNNGFPPTGKMVTADSPEGAAVEAALAGLQGLPTPKPSVLEKNITLN